MTWLHDGPACRHYAGKHYWAFVYPWGVETIFADGSRASGAPPRDAAFLDSAMLLGYGKDVYWHFVEHDVLHSFVAEHLWGRTSRSLWAQAHDDRAHEGPIPPLAQIEEDVVAEIQGSINDQGWARERLERRFPLDCEDIVRRAVRMLRPGGVCMNSKWAGRT